MKKTLTEQAAFLFAGNIAAYAVSILVPIVLVRIFPQSEYGVYRQLMLIFTTLLPLGLVGVNQGVYYFLPREPERKDAVMLQTWLFVFITGFICLIMLIVFRSLIAKYMNSPSLEEYLPLVSIYVFLMISSSFFETSMIAEGQAHYAALVKTGSEITRSVFVIIVALFSHKITLVLEALVLFALLRFLIQGIYLFKKYKLSLTQFEISFFRRMLGYSLPIGMSNTTYMLQKKLHSLVVSCFFNPTSFAIYSIGSFNLPIVGFVTSSVGQVMTPELSKCHKYGEKKRIISVWANAMRKQYIMIFPIFWFFLIMGYEFVVFMFTEQYIQSVPIFRISLFNLLIAGINTGAFLQAYAQTRYMLKIGLVRLPVALSVLYLCTKNFGMTGAIAADVFVSMAFRFFVVSKVVSVAAVSYKSIIMWSEIIKIFIIAFLAGLPILAIKFFINLNPFNMLAVSFPLYCICYLVLSSYYKIFQTKDIPFLSNILSGKYKYLTK